LYQRSEARKQNYNNLSSMLSPTSLLRCYALMNFHLLRENKDLKPTKRLILGKLNALTRSELELALRLLRLKAF